MKPSTRWVCVLVDDGAQRGCRIQRVAGRHSAARSTSSREELSRDRRVQQQAGVRRAHRALVVERPEDRLVHRGVQVGVGEHQIRALAAALQPHLLGVGIRGVAQEPFAGLGGTGEGDDVDIGVAAQRLARRGCPRPGTTLSTPSGRPASAASSASRSDESGACSAGLSTTLLPAASAGATFQTARSSGKFHGVTAPMTPSGSRVTSARLPGSVGVISPLILSSASP